MYFNRKNAEQKNWRMIKKGKHFLFGCSLVFAVGAALVAPSVKADDTVEAKPETSSTAEGTKPVAAEENVTYAAPAVEVAPAAVSEVKAEKPVETAQNSKEEAVATTDKVEKAKEADSIQAPEVTVVYDPSALTDEEKAKVVAAVKAANPTATDVQVQADGSAVVTFADGSSANLTAAQTIKDGSQVAKPRTNRAVRAIAPRSDGAESLDYTNKEDVEGYIKISYEVDEANNVIHWTVLDNPGRKGNAASGYVYFTIPKGSVGEPTNWKVVQTDKNGKVVNTRDYWKDGDGSYLMGQKGRMDTYTGAEMTKRLTELYKKTKNPAIKGNEAAVAAQTAERSQALYTMTADNNAIRNVMWTITYDTPILDKSKPLDYVAGLQGTGLLAGGKTNIMTGFTDNFIDNESAKFQAVAVKEKYTAKVGESFAADPATYVTNKAGTPEFPNNYRGATTFAWKDGQAPTATEAGTYTKTVVVTYPAHYKQAPQEVTITFEVEGEKPSKPVVDTDLTGKAGTKDPVVVTADPGTKVELFDKDGNKIGEATAGTDGKATITPTVDIPAGNVTATATKDGQTSDASDPMVATKDPAITPVVNPSALTDAEKAKVADEVKKANPTASKVEVGNDGTATVTFPDGSVAVLTPAKTVKEADSNGVKDPKAKTPVKDPANLTDAEKAKVADEVKKANPTATNVEVGKDGTTTVTFPDGSTATVTPDKTVKEADSNGVKDPEAKTPVKDPANLTDAEKAKVADEVKKANPTATDIKVNNDGSVVVTFADGSVAVIASENAVKEATKESAANQSAKKAGAKELPNTGTKQSSASLALALLAAATGGLLIAKKREEEE